MVDTIERESKLAVSWADFKRPERYQGGLPELAAALAQDSALLKRARRRWRKSRLQMAILARALAESGPEDSVRYLNRSHKCFRALILWKGGQPPRKLLDECYAGFLLLAEAALLKDDSEQSRRFALSAIECARLSFARDEREELIQDLLTRSSDHGELIPQAEAVQMIRGLLEDTGPVRSKFLNALLPVDDDPPEKGDSSESEIQENENSPPANDSADQESTANSPGSAPRYSWFNRHPCHLPIPQFLGEPEKTWIRLKLGRGLVRAVVLGFFSLIVFVIGEILCHVLAENALEALIDRAALGFLPEAPGALLPRSISTLSWAHLVLITLLLSVPFWWTQNTIRVALASLTFPVEAARQRLASFLMAGASTALLIVGLSLLATQTHMFYTASVLLRSLTVSLPEDPEGQLSALKLASGSHPEKSANQFDNYLHVLMGLHFERLEAYDDSIAQWGHASRRAYIPMPSRTFVNYEVQVRRRLHKTHEFQDAVRGNPEDPRPHADLGTYLLCHGRLKDAIEHLTTALKLNPDEAGLFSYDTSVPQAVRILEKNTRHIISSDDRGVDIAAGFLDAVEDTTVLHRLGWAAKQINRSLPIWAYRELITDKEKLLHDVAELCNSHPDHVVVQLNLAEFFNMVGRHSQAHSAFEKVEKLGGLDAQGYTTWGISLYYLKKYSSAIARFERAWEGSRRKKFVGNVLYRWGWSLARSNRWEEAEQKFQEAIKIEQGERKYHYQYGRALNYMLEYETAILQFEFATEPPFPHRSSYASWATSLNRLGRSAEASKLLSLAIRNKRSSSSTFKAIEETLQGVDQSVYPMLLDSVLHQIKDLRTDISSTWLPDIYMANTLVRLGDQGTARHLLYRLELFVPWQDRLGWITRSSEEYTEWGEAYLSSSLPELARLKFQAAIQADKLNPDAYPGLALAYLRQGRDDRAETVFKDLSNVFPDRPTNYSDFAEALEKQGQFARAAEYYAKSIEAGNSSKSTALAAVLAFAQSGEPHKGLDLIEHLNSQEEGRYYREITRAYMAVGEWEKAEAAVETMLKRSRSSSTNRQIAGFFELGRGNFKEAGAHFSHSWRQGKRDSVMRVLGTLCHTLHHNKQEQPPGNNGHLPWPEIAAAYIKGSATEQQLIQQATHLVNDQNRKKRLCVAHYVIAEKLLASELREKAMSHFRESIAQKHFISPVHWVAERRLKTETVQE